MSVFLSHLVVILLFMAGGAFFAGMETGIISLNRLRLRHLVRRKVPGAETIESHLSNPDMLLSVTLSGTNLCYVAASVVAADLGASLGGAMGTTIAAAVMSLAILVFCEYLPKAWFQSSPTIRVLPFAPALKWAGKALYPFSWSLMRMVRLIFPGNPRYESQPIVTKEELKHLAAEGEKTGILTEPERKMIHSIFELSGKTCAEIMTPKKDVVAVQTDTPADAIVNLARTREFNRFPVYDAAQKTFAGIVHVYDVLSDREPAGKTARDYMRPAQFVAHNTPADHVLPRMRVTRQPMIMVLDDRYDFIGVVTIEDVLEDVVGHL